MHLLLGGRLHQADSLPRRVFRASLRALARSQDHAAEGHERNADLMEAAGLDEVADAHRAAAFTQRAKQAKTLTHLQATRPLTSSDAMVDAL